MTDNFFSDTAITCNDISDPVNGQITFAPDTQSPFLHGTIASYSCTFDGENRIGFGLEGGNETRTCVGDGSSATGDWNGIAPTCERKTNVQSYLTLLETVFDIQYNLSL